MRYVSDRIIEQIKTLISCPVTFFESCAVYEIKWENTVEADRPQMTMWRMRIACWTIKADDTHSEYVIFIAFSLQQWLHERAYT
jgi:uncharacterized protein involved in propanediol utilization